VASARTILSLDEIMAFLIIGALALFVSASPSTRPAERGKCAWIHGRYAIYNGSGLRRMWVIGTRHMLALRDDDRDVPLEIDRYSTGHTEHDGMKDALFGNFRVCALERSRLGHTQYVRITQTKNLRYRGTHF
jgi:hypothetical protein